MAPPHTSSRQARRGRRGRFTTPRSLNRSKVSGFLQTTGLAPSFPRTQAQIDTDNAIDTLTQVLGRARIDRTRTRSKITIPSSFTHGIGPAEFIQQHASAYSIALIRNEDVTRVGFKSEDLIRTGALHGPPTEQMKSTLTGGIHPIFAEETWTDVPSRILQQIRPAMLLATKFLTTHQAMQHFLTVWQGKREVDHEMSAQVGKVVYRISSQVPLTHESAEATAQILWGLAGAKVIEPKHHGFSPDRNNSSPQKAFVYFHTDFLSAAHHFSEMDSPDPAQVLRFHFNLATTMIHEICHTFEINLHPDQTSRGLEVYMLGNFLAESGRAWETSMFGGAIHPINQRIDGTFGICVIEWPAYLGMRLEMRSISMQYICEIFQEDKWNQVKTRSLDELFLFQIPLGGAESTQLSSTSVQHFGYPQN